MNYYNEHDRQTAQWLRELIAAGEIPKGEVDERDIQEVEAKDVRGFTQCHFFAGIGGFSLALRLAGWPVGRECWTGSCPCQPWSAAGKGQGEKDSRHLWPHFLRLISLCRPECVFGEQVSSDAGYQWLARVRDDLEAASYAVGAIDLPACCAGAPHIRQRLFWVANRLANTDGTRHQGQDRPSQPGETTQLGTRAVNPCGGCGECDPEKRCVGCLHDFYGLEHAASDGRRERGSEPDGRSATGGRGVDGVGNAREPRRQGETEGRIQRRESTDDGDTGRLGNPAGERAIGSRQTEPSGDGQDDGVSWAAGNWSNSIPIICADGKWRRVPASAQPGFFDVASRLPADLAGMRTACDASLFPLAPTEKGRVGLLRGAGNSIVPAVAANFIRAFLETEREP